MVSGSRERESGQRGEGDAPQVTGQHGDALRSMVSLDFIARDTRSFYANVMMTYDTGMGLQSKKRASIGS